MKKKKKVDVVVYENTDKKGQIWVCFNEIAYDAFKLWLNSVALGSNIKLEFKREQKIVNFRRKTR